MKTSTVSAEMQLKLGEKKGVVKSFGRMSGSPDLIITTEDGDFLEIQV
jgi:hypothetical protein